jgi:hypothetical protein
VVSHKQELGARSFVVNALWVEVLEPKRRQYTKEDNDTASTVLFSMSVKINELVFVTVHQASHVPPCGPM